MSSKLRMERRFRAFYNLIISKGNILDIFMAEGTIYILNIGYILPILLKNRLLGCSMA
jgi:hypothetical protein